MEQEDPLHCSQKSNTGTSSCNIHFDVILSSILRCYSGITLEDLLLLQWLYSPLLGPGLFFSFLIIFTDGRTPWTSDQLVARPLPKHRKTQTE
jgi:hypothetical protein